MSRTDIADLLRQTARAMPALPRSQFVGFLAKQPGGQRSSRRKVHSWHKRRAARLKRASTAPRQGMLL